MTRTLRIAVADDEPLMMRWYIETLTKMGHEVCVRAANGRELLEGCKTSMPDLIITDVRMPDLSGIDAIAALNSGRVIPLIIVSAFHDDQDMECPLEQHVVVHLVKPIKQADLRIAIALVERRFREFTAVQKESANLPQAFEDRKVVERAKGILMKRTDLDEAEAFYRLQNLSQLRSQRLVDVAHTIVEAGEVLTP